MHITEIKRAAAGLIEDFDVTLATSRQAVMRLVAREWPTVEFRDRERIVASIENTLLDAASR